MNGIPMGRPLLPPAKMLMPYLSRIDENRWYTNYGPLVQEYEQRLSEVFQCYVAATSSCTSGMTAALLAQEIHGEVFLPSWTFVATANAARAAGLSVSLTDVDEMYWTPPDTDIVVAPFGAPVRYEDEVMTDAAGGFDAFFTGQSKAGAAPIVISTHATKVFSTGEGGLVLSTDKALVGRVRALVNHGIDDDRAVPLTGINGKLSEYGAALGLAELDNWAWKRNAWLDLKRKYLAAFGSLSHTTPLSSLSWVGSVFCLRLPEGERVRESLVSQGIASRKVYGDGVHRYGAYARCEKEPLPVTEALAKEVVFLPYSIDTTDAELERIVEAVQEARGHE